MPPNITLLPQQQYTGGIKLNGLGFLPKSPTQPLQRRAPPAYTNHYPRLLNKFTPPPLGFNNKCFTDGSTLSNPGRSSNAWTFHLGYNNQLLFQHNNFPKYQQYNILYPCSINIAELLAIQQLIQHIYQHHQHQKWPINTTFDIYTDSLVCYELFQQYYYSKYERNRGFLNLMRHPPSDIISHQIVVV